MRLVDRVREVIGLRPQTVWRAYQDVFRPGESTDIVKADLADLCGLMDSTDSDDPIVIARAEGRRQVFLAIMDRTNMRYQDVTEAQKRVDVQLGGE